MEVQFLWLKEKELQHLPQLRCIGGEKQVGLGGVETQVAIDELHELRLLGTNAMQSFNYKNKRELCYYWDPPWSFGLNTQQIFI